MKDWNDIKLHYEFIYRKAKGGSLNVEFHIEPTTKIEKQSDKYVKIGKKLKILEEKLDAINGMQIKFNPDAWNIGALIIQFEDDSNLKEVAKTMRMFIDATKDEITATIKKIQNEEE